MTNCMSPLAAHVLTDNDYPRTIPGNAKCCQATPSRPNWDLYSWIPGTSWGCHDELPSQTTWKMIEKISWAGLNWILKVQTESQLKSSAHFRNCQPNQRRCTEQKTFYSHTSEENADLPLLRPGIFLPISVFHQASFQCSPSRSTHILWMWSSIRYTCSWPIGCYPSVAVPPGGGRLDSERLHVYYVIVYCVYFDIFCAKNTLYCIVLYFILHVGVYIYIYTDTQIHHTYTQIHHIYIYPECGYTPDQAFKISRSSAIRS